MPTIREQRIEVPDRLAELLAGFPAELAAAA